MKRETEINALLMKAEKQLNEIQEEYDKSLHAKNISNILKVDIKNYCENLRSVLDYLAHTTREIYCPKANVKSRFYFPIFPDQTTFTSKVNEWFPNLKSTNKHLYDLLESFQPYHKNYKWLECLNKINNENKHGNLVEQTRNEKTRVIATSNNKGQVSWDPNSVRFGSGVYIQGVPVNPQTQMPIPSPTQTITKTIWVDFKFDGIDISVLGLLQDALKGIKSIVEQIKCECI